MAGTMLGGLLCSPGTISVNAALSNCEPVTIVTLQVLFKRLQGVKQRESVPLKPGPLLIAVYGDNW